MTFIDSPIARCEAVHEMVLLDETQRECAFEHECPPGRICPLDGCFARVSGLSEEHAQAMAARAAQRPRRAARGQERRENAEAVL